MKRAPRRRALRQRASRRSAARRRTSRGARAWTCCRSAARRTACRSARRSCSSIARSPRNSRAGASRRASSRRRCATSPRRGSACCDDGAWLRHAAHANAMAARLAAALADVPGARLPRAGAGQRRVRRPAARGRSTALRARGWRFYTFIGATGCRFMCAWDTPVASIDRFAARCARARAPRPDLTAGDTPCRCEPGVTRRSLDAISAGHLPGLLGFRVLVDRARDRLEAELAIRPELLAPNGYLHAATVIALADTACGYGCRSHLPPRRDRLHDDRAQEQLPRHRARGRDPLRRDAPRTWAAPRRCGTRTSRGAATAARSRCSAARR